MQLSDLEFRPDPLESEEIIALIAEHLTQMRAQSPACSVHAMETEALKQEDMSFWSVWQGNTLIGCAALKHLNSCHGEIKSMHVRKEFRGQGHAHEILRFIVQNALESGVKRLSLETGSQGSFAAARNLYLSHGFEETVPFADYAPDPNSFFMTRTLD